MINNPSLTEEYEQLLNRVVEVYRDSVFIYDGPIYPQPLFILQSRRNSKLQFEIVSSTEMEEIGEPIYLSLDAFLMSTRLVSKPQKSQTPIQIPRNLVSEISQYLPIHKVNLNEQNSPN